MTWEETLTPEALRALTVTWRRGEGFCVVCYRTGEFARVSDWYADAEAAHAELERLRSTGRMIRPDGEP